MHENIHDMTIKETNNIKIFNTIEDCGVVYDEINQQFGSIIADAVDALTRCKDESYLELILRAKENYFARHVKWADNQHNASDLKPGSLLDKYRMSQYILTH